MPLFKVRPATNHTREPTERYGNVDAGIRDPSANGWKMIEARK